MNSKINVVPKTDEVISPSLTDSAAHETRRLSDVSLKERLEYGWVLAGLPLWGPIRAVVRLTAAVFWLAACYTAFAAASSLLLISKRLGQALRKKVTRMWIHGMRAIAGIRIKCIGQPPASPYFLVCNHLSWQDFFVVNCCCDVSCVVQAEDETLPFIGTLFTGIRPIFVQRVREDAPRVTALMAETIRERRNLLMAPEGIVGPGREVRRFHACLLQAAVQTRRPVHYLSLTYRTPEGCPPPSKVALFGPDPYFRTPDGRIPESEIEAWGPERSFFLHALGVLALPWHEIVVRFAPDPITANDRFVLANRLHDAVERIFIPVE